MAEDASEQRPHTRPVVIIPARFSDSASALRYDAEVAASKLLQAVWDAGGEPLVVHRQRQNPGSRIWQSASG